METLQTENKERKNEVNEIEKIYVEEGIHSQNFRKQLINFIGFVLNRYSGDQQFPEDMLHFTYLRIMERLGAITPERPSVVWVSKTVKDDEASKSDIVNFAENPIKSKKKNEKKIEINAQIEWALEGKNCLFDASRSNLGNYIFSIARNAHSNYTYHTNKKLKELVPPATELPEPEIQYTMEEKYKPRVLQLVEQEPEYIPNSLKRYMLWIQNS